MTPEQFTLWLQGYVELNGTTPTDVQWLIIKDHLKLVFDKVTPNRDNDRQHGGKQTEQITSTPYPMPVIKPEWPSHWPKINPGLGVGDIIC